MLLQIRTTPESAPKTVATNCTTWIFWFVIAYVGSASWPVVCYIKPFLLLFSFVPLAAQRKEFSQH